MDLQLMKLNNSHFRNYKRYTKMYHTVFTYVSSPPFATKEDLNISPPSLRD